GLPPGLRLALDARQQRRHPASRPDPEPFANVGGRPGNADGVDQRIGDPANRLELFTAEIQLLERARIVGEPVTADEVVVEVLGARPHAANVQGYPRLEYVARPSPIVVDADGHVRRDRERLAGAAAGACARLA